MRIKVVNVEGILSCNIPTELIMKNLKKFPSIDGIYVTAYNGQGLYFRDGESFRDSTMKEWEKYHLE